MLKKDSLKAEIRRMCQEKDAINARLQRQMRK